MPAAQARPISLPRTTDTMAAGRSAPSASIAVALLLLQVMATAGETVLREVQYSNTATCNVTGTQALALVGTVQSSATKWRKTTCPPGGTATVGLYSNSAATTLANGQIVQAIPVGTCTVGNSASTSGSRAFECITVAQVVIRKDYYQNASCSDDTQNNMRILPLDTCETDGTASSKIYSVTDGKLTLQTYTTADCSGTATGGDIGAATESQCPAGGCPVDTCLPPGAGYGSWKQFTIRGSASGDASIVSKTSGAAATAASGVICALTSSIMFLA
jgi:hypothetical protein